MGKSGGLDIERWPTVFLFTVSKDFWVQFEVILLRLVLLGIESNRAMQLARGDE